MSDWRNQLDMIQNKIKYQLHARKYDDLACLGMLMAQFDQDNSGHLNQHEFEKFLAKLGVFLTSQELRAIYNTYDKNKDEHISYQEFIEFIRTSMSQKRLAVVKHAWQFLDYQNTGSLNLEQLFKQYNAAAHPRVRTRQKTAQEVFAEFQNSICQRSKDNITVTESEFLDYYADVNACLPAELEEYFVDIIFSTWQITSSVDYVSQERLVELETILYEKIRQKTNTLEDEAKTVQKAFKYFDLTDSGVIDMRQFTQALDKFGCVFNDKEIHALFVKFDKDKSGKICYPEFANFFAQMGSGRQANLNPVFQLNLQPPKALIQQLKKELKKRGVSSLRGMARSFQRSDKNKNGYLDRNEFKWALKEAGFVLTKTENDSLFKYFDKNCDDRVSYQEFISILRGDLYNQTRQAVVNEAFAKFDKDGSGQITLDDLRGTYDPTCNYQVQQGKKSPDDLLKEFLTNFDTLNKDGIVTHEEFHDYYNDLSANIDNDELFVAFVRSAWKL